MSKSGARNHTQKKVSPEPKHKKDTGSEPSPSILANQAECKIAGLFDNLAEDMTTESSSHLYLESLMASIPAPMVVLDLHGRIRTCNPAFEQLFGYKRQEVLGANLEDIVGPPGLAGEVSRCVQRTANAESVRMTTLRRHKNGSLIDVRVLGAPLVFNGKTIGSFGMYEDISGQRKAEVAQRSAEEKFRDLFDNAIEGIFQSTPEGRYLSVNPALAHMYGYSSPAEMISQVTDIASMLYVDPRQRAVFKREIEQNGFVHGFEFEVRRKDGTRIWLKENARSVRATTGSVLYYEGTVEDITERRRSELERQAATEIVRALSLTDSLDDLLRSVHAALRKVLYAENCFVALRDSPAGSFQFPFFVDLADPVPSSISEVDFSPAAYLYRISSPMLISPKMFAELVRQGEIQRIGPPAASWLGVPLRAAATTIGVLVVQDHIRENVYAQRDLEFLSSVGDQIGFAIERKRAEERMRESETRLRLLIAQLPAVLWTVDTRLRFTSVLGAGLANLGLKPDQIVGMPLQDFFETSDQTFVPIAAHRRAMAGEPVTFHVEWKDGSYACHVETLRGATGEIVGAICMALDVTDRKQLEEQFRQSQKMEAVGRLAGGIAHDFNNLLMVIQGYADLLTDRLPKGDTLRRNAEQIQLAAQRATALTQQLLAFSRKQMLAPKVLNIQNVVADMEKILRRLIGEDVELETSWEKDLWLVKADRSQIEQVIMNLAVNARDAMPSGGRLTIETANVELDSAFASTPSVLSPGKYVMLAVTDNGCGMDAKTQAHIFEPFFSTKEKGKGTGLGLATVYGIVKQSGGYVWVYSEPGHGTTFKIYLPRIEEETSHVDLDAVDSRSLPRGSEVVLLVEDEKGVRELAREYLQMSGYDVIEAEDGHTALELAAMHAGPIHLLLTDVVMPGISGRELADRVVQIRPGIKIIYMSGYTDQAVVRHGILDSEAVLLQKPFMLATLASKLREVLVPETVV